MLGRDLGWVAHRVGFETTSGFSRAYRAEFGVTPSAYRSLVPDVRGGEHERVPATPQVPASSTPPLVNDFHVIIWMYRGRARAHVGDRSWDLDTGDAIWLPAAEPNRVEVEADSIMMPIQSAPPPTRLTPGDAALFRVAPHHETSLLRAAVAQYTPLRPPRYDELALWRAFEDWSFRGVTTSPFGGPRDAPTAATMTSARRLLASGMSPGAAGVRLGYAHASSFSRAFTRAHGMSPRTFQRQGLSGVAET